MDNRYIENKPDEELCFQAAEFFKILGDPVRTQILHRLSEGEACVGTLVDMLSVTQSAVSHQLRLLRAARLIRSRRNGRQIFYSLDDRHVESIIKEAFEHLTER